MTPKLFIGKKTKGKYSDNTKFFSGEVSINNITKFFEGEVINHEVILSKTAALYDPLGFAAPLKVYGAYICRRALIESMGDPLREASHNTRHLFMQYIYQVKNQSKFQTLLYFTKVDFLRILYIFYKCGICRNFFLLKNFLIIN